MLTNSLGCARSQDGQARGIGCVGSYVTPVVSFDRGMQTFSFGGASHGQNGGQACGTGCVGVCVMPAVLFVTHLPYIVTH